MPPVAGLAVTALGGACLLGACTRSVSTGVASRAARSTGAEKATAWYPAGLLRAAALPPAQCSALQESVRQRCSRAIGWCAAPDGSGWVAERFALLLLNTEECCGGLLRQGTAAAGALRRLWSRASVVVVADGAANHLYDSAENGQQRRAMLPHCITGDLDSIRPDVREYYAALGVEIVEQPSQDSHDFQKSIAVATRHLLPQEADTGAELGCEPTPPMYVFCSTGGRFDHAAAIMGTLHEFSERPIVLVTPYNLIWLLRPGRHLIVHDKTVEGTTCGVLPIGQPVRAITSDGLKWDLGGVWGSLAMGELVSSSNEVVGTDVGWQPSLRASGLALVAVETSEPVVWASTFAARS